MGISRMFSILSFIASLPRSASAREFPVPSRTCLHSQGTAYLKGILPFYESMSFGIESICLPKGPFFSVQTVAPLRYQRRCIL
jgi:hypothetical protein